MHPRRLPWRSGRARQAVSAPPPGALYEITYANPGRRHGPAAEHERDAALDTARRMSARGEVVDVALVLDDGGRRPVASFAGGQPVPGAAARVPAAADAAQAPVSRLRGTGDIRAAAVRYPDGISPLPDAATSGGPLRPRRLLHPDGTRLVCRPDGRSGPRWTGVADGVVPSGSQPGAAWLQVVRRDDPAGLVTLHPALIAPAGVDPYACTDRRQRRRFGAFDVAEAAGRAAARLPAVLVDAGDFIVAQDGAGSLQVIQSALVCGAMGVSVRLLAEDLSGDQDVLVRRDADLVEVELPACHPAESGPQARRLFAPGTENRIIPAPRQTLLWEGGR